MWICPNGNESILLNFLQSIQYENSLILNINKTDIKYKENDCHNNVNKFLKNNYINYGKILGYYIVINKINELFAIQHSIIYDIKNKIYIDITPCSVYDKKFFIYGYKIPEYKYIKYKNNKIIETEKTMINNIDGYFL